MPAAALALLVALAMATPAMAQDADRPVPAADIAGAQAVPETQTPAQPAAPQAQAPDRPAAPDVDASKLGVSMSRIRQGLRISEEREQRASQGPRLHYQLQVYGAAPRIDILKDFDIGHAAPMQYGAPTHAEFVNHWTPHYFRSPPVPLSALAVAAVVPLVKRAKKLRCEDELAEYRALVMQGVSAAPPRCAQ